MSRRRVSKPLECTSCPEGMKPTECPLRERECQGRTDRGKGGDGTSPTTREIGASKASGRDERRTVGMGTAVDGDSVGSSHRYIKGADGARPGNGTQRRRKYVLLSLTEPADNPAAVGTQVIRDGH